MKINRYFPSFFSRLASATFYLIAAFSLSCVFAVLLRFGAASETSKQTSEPFVWDASGWPDDGFPLLERLDGPVLAEIWRSLEKSENATKIAPFSNAVDLQLRRQGPSYRGKPLALRGRLLRGAFVPTSGVDESTGESSDEQDAKKTPERAGYFDLWILLPDSKRNPVRLLTRRAPKSFVPDARIENSSPYPRDVEYRRETVEALAVYYRTTAFDAGDDFFAAPTLVALDFQTSPETNASDSTSPIRRRAENASAWSALGVKLAVLFGIVAIWIVVRTTARKKRSKNARKTRRTNKASDLPDSIEPFLVAAFCFVAISAAPCRANDAPSSDSEFWAAAFGKNSATWLRETCSIRPRLDSTDRSEAAERRETALLAFERLARIVSPSVLKERFGTSPLGDFVATEPKRRPVFPSETTFRPFCGTLRAVETLPTAPDEIERFGVSAIFRAVVELDSNERVVVYSPFLPRFSAPNEFFDASTRRTFESNAEETGQECVGTGERVAFFGLMFGTEIADSTNETPTPVALTSRIGWFPVDSPLGRRGVDLSTFETVPVFPIRALETESDLARKKAVARSLRWTSSDRAPFYESLAAVGRSGVSTETSENASVKTGGKGKKKAAENVAKSERKTNAQANATPIVALFNRPEENQGRAVRLRGWVRRVNTILVDDPDVRAATGLERYAQLYLFANDSQGWPLVLCVPELPDGLQEGGGQDFRREIEFAGFFYKTWAYRTSKKEDFASENANVESESDGEGGKNVEADSATANWTLVPLLIGRVSKVYSEDEESARSPFSSPFLIGAFAVLASAWVAVRFWGRRR